MNLLRSILDLNSFQMEKELIFPSPGLPSTRVGVRWKQSKNTLLFNKAHNLLTVFGYHNKWSDCLKSWNSEVLVEKKIRTYI